ASKAYDSWWVTFVSDYGCLDKTSVRLDDFRSLVLQLNFKCVFPDDLHGSHDLHRSCLRRKSSMILFRDSGQTLLILNDFHVSRRMDDF
ncbi:hypothetical protein IGI04_022628, partial [Brassica rapa subsp. trilocularis]